MTRKEFEYKLQDEGFSVWGDEHFRDFRHFISPDGKVKWITTTEDALKLVPNPIYRFKVCLSMACIPCPVTPRVIFDQEAAQ